MNKPSSPNLIQERCLQAGSKFIQGYEAAQTRFVQQVAIEIKIEIKWVPLQGLR